MVLFTMPGEGALVGLHMDVIVECFEPCGVRDSFVPSASNKATSGTGIIIHIELLLSLSMRTIPTSLVGISKRLRAVGDVLGSTASALSAHCSRPCRYGVVSKSTIER